jgi:hypothetical protein
MHAVDARSRRTLDTLWTPELAQPRTTTHPHHPKHGLSILKRSLRYNDLSAAAKSALTKAAKHRTARLDLKLD